MKKGRKQRVSALATMSVLVPGYYGFENRVTAKVDPEHAALQEGFSLVENLLKKLQKRGVKPGTHLKITIETVKRKRGDITR